MSRIVFVVERPTQFEVPLYRHAARDPHHSLRVLFTDPDAGRPVHDPELGKAVSWGSGVLEGYDHAVAPAHDSRGWLLRELGAGFDLVVVNGYTRRPYLAAALASRRSRSRTALRLDSAAFGEIPRRRRVLRRLLFLALDRLFDDYLAVGTLTVTYLRSLGVDPRRIGRFPYPVDAERFAAQADPGSRAQIRGQLGAGPATHLILAIAKLHPRETPWDLLRALALMGSTSPGERLLVLAGDGPDREAVESFVAAEGLPAKLLGYVPYTELPGLYAAADVFVHAPREERWGVSVGEALACGVPVVAGSCVGAAEDLVVDGANGFRYPTGNAAALAQRLDAVRTLERSAAARATATHLAPFTVPAAWGCLVAAATRNRQELAA